MKRFIFLIIVAFVGYAFYASKVTISDVKSTTQYLINDVEMSSNELISSVDRRYYWDIPEDEIPVFGEINIYANPKEYTVTVKQKGKEDRTFKMDEIPDIYFSVNNIDGIHYSPNLPCIYNGKYGLVNENGDIVESFRWDAEKYYMIPESNDILIIERKNENNYHLLVVNENKREIF